jgi:hypothetical protein
MESAQAPAFSIQLAKPHCDPESIALGLRLKRGRLAPLAISFELWLCAAA